MTTIIGFAGKKQSGKNTSCNFIVLLKLLECGVCSKVKLDDYGNIFVSDIFGQRPIMTDEYFPLSEEYVDIQELYNSIGVKIYAFADALKDLAINLFNIPRHKVYGTDAQKAEPSGLFWENMPSVVTKELPKPFYLVDNVYHYKKGQEEISLPIYYHPAGEMSIREVLQFVGTEIFRKMHHNVWLETLHRKIISDNMELALICDVRFDNEIEFILSNSNSYVIGLDRNGNSDSSHKSEQADLSKCSCIINNSTMTIPEQNKAIYAFFDSLNLQLLPKV